MTISPSAPPPIACTLAAGNFKERLTWIADLNRASLRNHCRDDLRLQLTYAPEAIDQVREMVRRERDCCAFLTFALRQDADAVRLTIEAPEAAREAADTVFGPFLGGGADQAACACGGNVP